MKTGLSELASHAGEAQLREIEKELEQQKTRLNEAMKLSTDELKKIISPDSLTENIVGHVTRKYPFHTSLILFVTGVLAVGVFKIDQE